jgi:hypothetical protein
VYDTGDKVANIAALTLALALPVVVLIAVWRSAPGATPGPHGAHDPADSRAG